MLHVYGKDNTIALGWCITSQVRRLGKLSRCTYHAGWSDKEILAVPTRLTVLLLLKPDRGKWRALQREQ